MGITKNHPGMIPPWINDPQPHLWVPIAVAARVWFKCTTQGVRMRIARGTMELPTFYDGARWFIRLPKDIAPQKQTIASA
jgi:hypothetical protein